MTHTSTNMLDLDPALRHRDGEKAPLTEEELALQRDADREAVSTLYAGLNGMDTTLIPGTLLSVDRRDIGINKPEQRAVAAEEVIDTLQGNRLDAIVHDKNTERAQLDASDRLTQVTGKSEREMPAIDAVERRVFGEDLDNDKKGKVTEGIGLDFHDQREVTRAATAGEFMDMVAKRHDTSGLENLPTRTGIWIGARLQRFMERYGDADHTPTEELAVIGRYLENVEAVAATSSGESFVTFDEETGQPEKYEIDDIVSAAMAGDFDALADEGIDLSDDDRTAIEDINDAFEMAYPDKSSLVAHADRIRMRMRQIFNESKQRNA